MNILTHHRGWVNRHEAVRLLSNLNITSNRSNGKVLTVRMELVSPWAGKIENAPVVDDDVNPS